MVLVLLRMVILDHRPTIRSSVWLVIALPLALLVLGAMWWSTRGTGYDRAGFAATYHQVTAHSEAHLYYPGSLVFSPFGGSQRSI